uniref:Putative short-chain dehydrogenase n=1 Tax=Trypanosoma congolense (strain IL3000) TaxID=1068625 RepID=G0UWQ8_TRYCI|nr:putative short-chain dehydrogenase [Trypanosoma congolense IL3000]
MIFLLFISFLGWLLWTSYSLFSYKTISVEGKTVVITGGSSGIGKCLAIRFLRLGAVVHVLDDNKEKLKQLVKEAAAIVAPEKGNENTNAMENVAKEESENVDSSSENLINQCNAEKCNGANDSLKTVLIDLSNRFHLNRLLSQIGAVDIVVNAAVNVSSRDFLDHEDNAIERILHVNAMCPLILAKAFLPSMLLRQEGHFVTITDANGLLGNAAQPDLAASQWAAVGAHESIQMLIRESGKSGKIHTTLVCPYNMVVSRSLLRTPSPFSSSRALEADGVDEFGAKETVRVKRGFGVLERMLSIFRRPSTPEEAADACIMAITHGVERVYIPYSLVFLPLFRVLPAPWFMWMVSPTASRSSPAALVGRKYQGDRSANEGGAES